MCVGGGGVRKWLLLVGYIYVCNTRKNKSTRVIDGGKCDAVRCDDGLWWTFSLIDRDEREWTDGRTKAPIPDSRGYG